jgi:hypothetical protein
VAGGHPYSNARDQATEVAAVDAERCPRDQELDAEPPNYARSGRPASALGAALRSDWEFWPGYWPIEGLRGVNKSGDTRQIALETPFAAWQVSYVTLLPTDKVLFQLGERQICVYDPAARTVALVARGRCPIPVLDDAAATTHATTGPTH